VLGGVLASTRSAYSDVARVYAPVAAAVALIVLGFLAVAVLRFRAGRRPGPPSRRSEARRLEVALVAGLALIAAALAAFTIHVNDNESAIAARPAVTIDATASRWHWRWDYPALHVHLTGGRSLASPALVVPAGRPVEFRLTSVDVIHSLWFPSLDFKRDAFPSSSTRFDVTFPSPGWLSAGGLCAAFCGLRHADMRFSVIVLSPRAFASWARSGGRST
jgi:cytochrome c oxidase subunit 2